MPIYEYQCAACGAKLEQLQKISDAPLSDCPECHQASLRRLVSAAGFRLKGGGWYETDFKSGGKRNLVEKADAGSDSAADGQKGGKKAADGAAGGDQAGGQSQSGQSKPGASKSNESASSGSTSSQTASSTAKPKAAPKPAGTNAG